MEDPKKKLPSLPSNYVTLQQLQELKLREQQKHREEEEREKQLQKQREEEEEERERQLQKQREEEEENEREKLLQKSIKTLEAKAPKRFSGKYRKSRFQKDGIIPAVEGEIDGQERKVEEPKFRKKKLKGRKKVKETLDAVLGKSEGNSAGRDRSKNGEISMEISVPTLEIIQKIGDLAICDCEKTGETDGSGAKSTAETRGDSSLNQGFEWRTKLVPKIVDREKNGSDGANKRSTATRGSFRIKKDIGGRPESLRQSLFLDCEKPGELDGSDGVDERPTADKIGYSRKKGFRGRPEEPMRQMVVVDFEKPRKKDGSDEADEKSTAENVVRFQRKTDSVRKPERVRQIVVADCEKTVEVDGFDRAVEKFTAENRGSFRKRRHHGGRQEPVRQIVVADCEKRVEVDGFDRAVEKFTAENRGNFRKRRHHGGRQEPVRQIVVADCETRGEMDGSYGADESSTAENRGRFGRRGLRRRAAVYQTWVRKDDISEGAPAGFQCSSRQGRPSGRGEYTETASVS